MKIIHTADWHLGRTLHGVSLIEEQRHALEGLLETVAIEEPDLLIVAGDVYDRAVPPREAVALLDWILSELTLTWELPVVIIAENHDSPERLAFASGVLARQNVHVFSRVSPQNRLTLQAEDGPLHLYALPYAEPVLVREALGRDDLKRHDEAMRALVNEIRQTHLEGERSLLIAHLFASGGSVSESERPLTAVGGAEMVSLEHFAPFDYVALGHLHRPQSFLEGRVRYAGSLCKYSFDEATHEKSLCVVEMDAAGACNVRCVPLAPRRDVRCIEGTLEELLEAGKSAGGCDDYLHITLLDKGKLFEPMARLREVYPNTLRLERRELELRSAGDIRLPADYRTLRPKDLFAAFWEHVTGEELEEAEQQAFSSILDGLAAEAREAKA